MINVIGARRLLTILILALGIGVMAAAFYMYIQPEAQSLQNSLNDTRNRISAAQEETNKLRNEFDVIQAQKVKFEQLQAADFLTAQDRVQARERFEAIQRYARVLLASYDIKSAQVERNDDLTAAHYVMLNSPVTVQVDALDDMDFYNFMFLVQNAFPGHAGIDRLEIRRVRELDDVTLRQIGTGVPTVMVKGTINFTWKTIVPEDQIQAAGVQQTGM